MGRRLVVRLAVPVLVAAAAVSAEAPASAQAGSVAFDPARPTAAGAAWGRVIVRVRPDAARAAADAVGTAGGRVVARQAALGMFVAEGPAGVARAVAGVPGVTGVSPDRSVTLNALGFDPATQPGSMTNFYGMAPDSRLISLQLADHDGLVDISQVIAAIDWVAQFGRSNGLNVRVLNLSFGVDSPQSPTVDPLSWAAEVAWKRGIVVVASAGNQGDTYPGLNSPAYNLPTTRGCSR